MADSGWNGKLEHSLLGFFYDEAVLGVFGVAKTDPPRHSRPEHPAYGRDGRQGKWRRGL